MAPVCGLHVAVAGQGAPFLPAAPCAAVRAEDAPGQFGALAACALAAVLDAAAATLPALQACFYVLMCQFFCGILLGYVFIQSHNGMEIYSDGRDFVTSQLASTRNIHGGVFNDWCASALACMIPHAAAAPDC